MTLSQFLTNLNSPEKVQLTIVDLTTNREIADLKANGHEALDDTIEAKEISQWYILSASHIKVVVDMTTEPEP